MGEIGSFADSVLFARLVIGEISDEGQSPPRGGDAKFLVKRGRTEGARKIATERFYSEPLQLERNLPGNSDFAPRLSLSRELLPFQSCTFLGMFPTRAVFDIMARMRNGKRQKANNGSSR
ncbi:MULTISPECIES: hypothetical protein [unclassified Mesorhizobium]|uniref:hypothetical protein n=1 Tax=unclassified Mesorhizobium TaxID=325217 RepID=UPI000FE93867|nr:MULTISPECIES: hypothetical protein [unclassified Mesorhizobium]RWI20529.1 MAG: hypothetical protein EOQ92_19790 [Mesorhizobium sp.]RWK93837.1 MAG: hypothetical protein EOR53_21400 [Mesorhizobium sp.]RWK96609.1 MAG: hypothetical protein EOR45_24225 [Mesorhizobium sp.]TIP56733.1 MAG: hypothetical protein E5X56_23170 [Mesorhizobium sp.]TIQ20133.1 MAG: hypothetical protein E5X51_17210 [Mesorhizobium sp.]